MQSSSNQEYLSYIQDIIEHPLVRTMDRFIHHSDVTCLEHSLSVSYHSFLLSKRLGLDCRSAARSGLLHDFYLYDWHLDHPVPGLHGFTHPKTALKNARMHFSLSNIEADSIASHMWPLTLCPPRNRIAWLICLVDKYCALVEVFRISRWQHLHAFKHTPAIDC